MSHQEKQRIFDQHAESMGFDDWDHLVNDFECKLMTIDEFQSFMFEACDLVQEEQQKRIAQKLPRDGKSNLHCAGVKDLITNPENKIS